MSGLRTALWLLLTTLGTWLFPPAAHAVIGTQDNVPGATLLLPHFEVDVANPNGITTTLSLSNTSATATLANVTLWSTESVSLLNFNIYLTGYDTQPLNLRDVLAGTLPRTASDGQDPTDTISPQGPLSQDINFASCTGVLPPAPLPAAEVADLVAGLSGQPMTGQGNLCASANQGDGVARGYLTIDLVSGCDARDPDDSGYPALMAQQNVFVGQYRLINPAQNFSSGESLVALEGSNSNPLVTTSGNYTFYGRYNNGTAADRREPLGVRWAQARVTEAGSGTGASTLLWRDTKRGAQALFACGSGAAALRIATGSVTDRNALGDQLAVGTAGSVAPQSSQRLPISIGPPNSSLIAVDSKIGWLEFNLNHTLGSGNLFGNSAQSYPINVNGSYSGQQGRFQVSSPPVQLQVVSTPPSNADNGAAQ